MLVTGEGFAGESRAEGQLKRERESVIKDSLGGVTVQDREGVVMGPLLRTNTKRSCPGIKKKLFFFFFNIKEECFNPNHKINN